MLVDWKNLERVVEEAARDCDLAVAACFNGAEGCWAWRGDVQFPAASTIKLAILVALFQAVDTSQLNLEERVALESGAKVPGSGVLLGMGDGLSLSLADLAYLMIAVSDNTASNLLIDRLSLPTVGNTIAAFRLHQTALNRRFLGRAPRGNEPDNLTSAGDLVTLLSAIAEGRAASPASCTRMRELLLRQQHRDRIARNLPDGVTFGGKSGELPGLCHDTALLQGPSGTLTLAVLSRSERDADPYTMEARIGCIAAAACESVGWGTT